MSAHFIFPKPSDWNTFEDIVCDVYSRKLGNYNLQRYGRSGQKQYGVDIVGSTKDGLLGIQCKHHPTGKITVNEIDDEIAKAEVFRPKLDLFIIVTSADRDNHTHTHVLEVSQNREAQGKYPVAIKYWGDIYNWLTEFPDLVYKHFTRYFPISELTEIRFPRLRAQLRTTLHWPVSAEQLEAGVTDSLRLPQANSYNLTLGVTSFPDVSYDGVVDLEVSLHSLFRDESSAEGNFDEVAKTFNDIKAVVHEPYFSRELWLYLQTRLTAAFLLGWVFRRVTQFDLRLVFRDQVWATSGLPLVLAKMRDGLPVLCSKTGTEVVLVLNVSRNIDDSVKQFVNSWDNQPRAILSYDLEGNSVTSAAHALAIALEVSGKIKNVVDRWRATRIHLFCAMPAALATMIGYHLNAICPIVIYFRDSSRTKYVIGGTITNNL